MNNYHTPFKNTNYSFNFKIFNTSSKNLSGRKPVANRFFFNESFLILRDNSANFNIFKHHFRIILWFWATVLSDVVL